MGGEHAGARFPGRTGARGGRRQQPPAIRRQRAGRAGEEIDLVAVHDAVRPFIDLETIHKAFDEAAETGAAIVGVPAVDTVKQVSRAPAARASARPCRVKNW